MRPDYAKASDADLLAAAEPDAFAVIYDRHVARLYSWARSRAGDHAAELTAEVFARAWLCRRSFRDRANGSALPWLYGIARGRFCAIRSATGGSRIAPAGASGFL